MLNFETPLTLLNRNDSLTLINQHSATYMYDKVCPPLMYIVCKLCVHAYNNAEPSDSLKSTNIF